MSEATNDTPALVAVTTALLSNRDLATVLERVLSGEQEPVEMAFRDRTRVRRASRLVASLLPPQRPILGRAPGPASAWVRRTTAPRRAAYALAAARRLASREPDVDAERRYLAQHLAAERARDEAAAHADLLVVRYGPVLGWHARRDSITDATCAQLHGGNFRAARPPAAGLPGTLHGGACRCRAGPPFPGGRLLV